MARRVRDATLDSRQARQKLKAQGKPYFRLIEPGLHLGYRRLRGRAGSWCARHYIGEQQYKVEGIGIADDLSDADGVAILSFWQAQAMVRAQMSDRAHTAAGKSRKPVTVDDAMSAYLEFLGAKRKSVYDARRRYEVHIRPKLGELPIADLTADVIRRWHHALAKGPPRLRTSAGEKQRYREVDEGPEAMRRRQASANRVLTILKAGLNRAWREGHVPSDTAWRRVEPFENVDAARVRYLTVSEAKRLINACDPEFRPLVQAALATGCRYGELTRLQAHDFNPDSGTLAIRQSKSGRARHVVLTDEGAELFRQLAAGRTGSELLLRRANGGPWKPSTQIRPMAEACRRAKIDPPISFHSLRHTFASLAVMSGAPMAIVARSLGHADTRMCEKHYAHFAPSFEAETIRRHAPRFGFKPDRKIATIG